MIDKAPNSHHFEKRLREQEEVRDIYRAQKDNIQNAASYEKKMREWKEEAAGTMKLKVWAALMLVKYATWTAPMFIKKANAWSERYGRELTEAMNWYEGRVHGARNELAGYLDSKYGIAIHDLDLGQGLPKEMERDSELQELASAFASATSEMEQFQARYLTIPLQDPAKELAREVRTFATALFPELGPSDLTPDEKRYFQLKNDCNTTRSMVELFEASMRSTPGIRPDQNEFSERLKETQMRFDDFINSHPGVRERAEYKVYVRKND